ncbi:MAG: phosphatase PAP2 family protein [Prevotellaceae bacterium]|jgi:undecaprenyl-diphosphatase|nr:phosphatase PAP2 family protein [Prevotellaceae bacterium]
MDWLIPYEKDLFFLINGSRTPFLNNAMLLYSGALMWITAALMGIGAIVYKNSWRQWLPIVGMLITVFIFCLALSSGFTKPLFTRFRPIYYPEVMDQVRTLYTHSGGIYGFISGHTTHAFGIAISSALLFRNKWYTISIILWAAIMGYSRIYLGVHFVSDVVAGMVVGSLIGWTAYKLYRYFTKRYPQIAVSYSKSRVQKLSLAILCSIALSFVLGGPLTALLH